MEQHSGPGAPTKYKTAFNKQVRKLCLLSATDEQIAEFFEVSRATIYNWKNEYPAFAAAMKNGKLKADADMAESFFKCGTGYDYVERTTEREAVVKLDEHGQPIVNEEGDPEIEYKLVETKNVTKHIPANGRDALKWLNNRTKNWRDKVEVETTITEVKQVFKIGDTEIEL